MDGETLVRQPVTRRPLPLSTVEHAFLAGMGAMVLSRAVGGGLVTTGIIAIVGMVGFSQALK